MLQRGWKILLVMIIAALGFFLGGRPNETERTIASLSRIESDIEDKMDQQYARNIIKRTNIANDNKAIDKIDKKEHLKNYIMALSHDDANAKKKIWQMIQEKPQEFFMSAEEVILNSNVQDENFNSRDKQVLVQLVGELDIDQNLKEELFKKVIEHPLNMNGKNVPNDSCYLSAVVMSTLGKVEDPNLDWEIILFEMYEKTDKDLFHNFIANPLREANPQLAKKLLAKIDAY